MPAKTNWAQGTDHETGSHTTNTNLSGSANLSLGNIQIFNGFSVTNNIRNQKIAVLRGVEQYQQVIDNICLNVVSAYFNVLNYHQRIKIAQEQLDAQRRNLESSRIKEEEGMVSNSNVLQFEARVAENELSVISWQNNYNNALLTELNKEGATIIMVTHSQHDASFAHRVINLFDGEIVHDVKQYL